MDKKNTPIFNLDADEQALSDAFETEEWTSVPQLKEQKTKARKAAQLYLRKDARVNIRMSSSDLERLKQIAAYEGLPYQTLISSVLHKFSAGHPNR